MNCVSSLIFPDKVHSSGIRLLYTQETINVFTKYQFCSGIPVRLCYEYLIDSIKLDRLLHRQSLRPFVKDLGRNGRHERLIVRQRLHFENKGDRDWTFHKSSQSKTEA